MTSVPSSDDDYATDDEIRVGITDWDAPADGDLNGGENGFDEDPVGQLGQLAGQARGPIATFPANGLLATERQRQNAAKLPSLPSFEPLPMRPHHQRSCHLPSDFGDPTHYTLPPPNPEFRADAPQQGLPKYAWDPSQQLKPKRTTKECTYCRMALCKGFHRRDDPEANGPPEHHSD